MYHKTPANSVKFIIIDVDHPPNDDARLIVKTYYKGYIPSQVLIGKGWKSGMVPNWGDKISPA